MSLKNQYPKWNYRYVLYAKSKNMTPSECLEKDEGTFEYSIWIDKNVKEYEKLKNEDGTTYKKVTTIKRILIRG